LISTAVIDAEDLLLFSGTRNVKSCKGTSVFIGQIYLLNTADINNVGTELPNNNRATESNRDKRA
jgi:hypothetical protein